ncbi:MAG: preprotein translocase subunit SecY [Bacteroidia bacterium]
MKNFFNTVKNIFSIEELRSKILNTLLFLLVYRLGSFVVLPGVNPDSLDALKQQTSEGILGLLNMFSGGAFSNASIFALGIMPYISASIVVQLLTIAIPYFQKMQKEGESGRKKMNQITRYLTVLICSLQAPSYLANLNNQIGAQAITETGSFFWISSTIILVAGTMFIMWLGERITDRGIGNGISLIIMVGIIAELPGALIGEFGSRIAQAGGGTVMFLIELIGLLLVIILAILLVQGIRRVPVQVAKRISGNTQVGGVRQYIPLRVNTAGVMPIIFAQAIMFIPITVAGFANLDSLQGFMATFANVTGFWYNFTFAVLIIVFTYFYTAIAVNPQNMAEEMKRSGGFVPGVKPGQATADFIDTILSRITLPGAVFLAFLAIMPSLAMLFGVTNKFAQFYGGTSLLILVGVVLDTLQQIESHLLMRQYDGLMKSGKIKGRAMSSAVGMEN